MRVRPAIRVLTLLAVAILALARPELARASSFTFNGFDDDGMVIWDGTSDVRTDANDCGLGGGPCLTSSLSSFIITGTITPFKTAALLLDPSTTYMYLLLSFTPSAAVDTFLTGRCNEAASAFNPTPLAVQCADPSTGGNAGIAGGGTITPTVVELPMHLTASSSTQFTYALDASSTTFLTALSSSSVLGSLLSKGGAGTFSPGVFVSFASDGLIPGPFGDVPAEFTASVDVVTTDAPGVPEPATLTLLVVGLGALEVRRRAAGRVQ